MNIEKLKTRFEQMSIDQLAEQLDRHVDEPLELRIIEEVLKSKIGAMVKEAGQSPEPELDGRTCPSAINSPSTASFESVTPRGDSNSTEKQNEMFGPELKPSPAPNRERRWVPDHVPAVPNAAVVGAAPIHGDGTQSNTFIGEVIPGLIFCNPGRQEGRAVHIPLASEVLEK